MDKLLELREFDIIVCNKNYENESYYKYLPKPIFEELERLIQREEKDSENSDALDFLKAGYRRGVGEIIQVRNYVGMIQMKSGYQIQILPKLSLGREDMDHALTKKIFLKMLCCLKDFPARMFHDGDLETGRMNMYEIFIHMYILEVWKLVKKGIQSSYIPQENNVYYYKGKLLVGAHIKNNLLHKERFYVSYDEFQVNRAENRLIKATLMKLSRLSGCYNNIRRLRQLLGYFDQVPSSVHYKKDFSEAVPDRTARVYDTLMNWSKVFLLDESFTTFSGNTQARTLLFPMEKIFEAYVAHYIKKIFGKNGWNVSVQDHGHYLFDEPVKQFALRPDIVIERGDGCVIVMDTKWKRLIPDEQRHYGIAQADMYQMYAYSKKYNASEVWLLYPLCDEIRSMDNIYFKSVDGVRIHICFVDVANIEESIEVLSQYGVWG